LRRKNLHRQILYTLEDLHFPKAEVAAKRLEKLNPLLKAEAITENLNPKNAEQLLKGTDCVVDGLDNMSTRYAIKPSMCEAENSVHFWGSHRTGRKPLRLSSTRNPCLECIMPNLSDTELQTCNTRGVLGATPGIIGAMQALETIKVITGAGIPLKGKLMVCDFNDMSFATIDISKRANCPTCKGEAAPDASKEKLVWLCGTRTANVNPEKVLKLDFDKIYEKTKQHFKVQIRSRLAIIFSYRDLEVSLFNGGRMLIKNVTNEKAALEAYREILQILEIKQ